MLNFKKVLLGECSSLDVQEQSQWPELGEIIHKKNSSRKKSRNFVKINEDNKNSETNYFDHHSNASLLPSTSKNNLPSSGDFPNLTECIDNQLEKQCRLYRIQTHSEADVKECTQVNKENTRSAKCKKPKISLSKAPISIDGNLMLKISLSLAERKRQNKRTQHCKKRSLPLQEQFSIKSTASGNKLDSDCPIRHKGKKRPHKRLKPTKIKRHFQWAATKSTKPTNNVYLNRINRLRQIILTEIGQGQPIDDLVKDLNRLGIEDVQNTSGEQQHLFFLDNVNPAKTLVHTKNFRPYCDHISKPSLKKKANEFINTLRIYQDNMYARNPLNCKSRKRYVCGCHEARKFIRIDSVKLLFIAKNLMVDNGMPPILEELLNMSKERGLPVIYAGTSMDLGMWTLKKRKTSVIAILNYEGAEKLFNELLGELEQAKNDYKKLVQNLDQHLQNFASNDEVSSLQEDGPLQIEVEQRIRENIISKLS